MAKFVKQTSDLAEALGNLQDLASEFISLETARRSQLGREKEARQIEAYKYLIAQEDVDIKEHEMAINTVKENLLARGVELEGLSEEYKGINAQDLLTSANEGALEMLQVMYDDARAQKDSFERLNRHSASVKRHIDLLDEAVSMVDPGYAGDKYIVDAEDVVEAAKSVRKAGGEYEKAEEQYLEFIQTPEQLAIRQTDYYARLAKEAEEKVTAATAEATEDVIALEMLKSTQKETQEAVGAQLPLFEFRESYGPLISIQTQIMSGVDSVTGKDLGKNEMNDLEIVKAQELRALGTTFYPWITLTDQSVIAAGNLQSAIMSASGVSATGQRIIPRYDELLNYFKVANFEYKDMLATPGMEKVASNFQAEMLSIFGVDVSSTEWVKNITQMNDWAELVDIEQGNIEGRRAMSVFPQAPVDEEDEEDLLLKQFLEGGLGE